VIVTGYGRKALPYALADLPVIEKPFHPETLVNTVAGLFTKGSVDTSRKVETWRTVTSLLSADRQEVSMRSTR
jgi:hypothetical protein